MKTIGFCSLLVLISTGAFAQFNTIDPYLINPSLGGHEEMVKIGSIAQSTMNSYDNYPKTLIIWGSSPFNSQRVAGGFKVISEEKGIIKNNSAEFTFIYQIPISPSKLSFGLSGSFNQLDIIRNKVEVFDQNDPILNGSSSGNWVNANVGVSISKVNQYHFGLAVYNLLPYQTNLMIENFKNITPMGYIVSGEYSIPITNGNIICKMFGFAHTESPENTKNIHYNVGTRFMFLKDFWINAGYLDNNRIQGGFGLNIQNISFGYTGVFCNNSQLQNYPIINHEIILMIKMIYSKQSKG